MASRKLKKIFKLFAIVALIGGGYFVYTRFIQRDKMGGRMKLDNTAAGAGDNVIYNGVKIKGWVQPGTLRVESGYYVGMSSAGIKYKYTESGWVTA